MGLMWWLVMLTSSLCVSSHFVTLFEKAGWEGKSLALQANDQVSNGTFQSISTTFGSTLVVEVFPQVDFNGTKKFIRSTPFVGDLEKVEIKSFRVIDANQAMQEARNGNPNMVVVQSANNNLDYVLDFQAYAVGERVAHSRPWIIQSMDVPPGLSVEAFYMANFQYPSYEVNSTMKFNFAKSFKVWKQGQVMPRDYHQAIIIGNSDQADLVIQEGDSVPSIDFLSNAIGTLRAIYIPSGYKLVGYWGYNFVGASFVLTSQFIEMRQPPYSQMRSFMYMRDSGSVLPPPVDQSLIVRCGPYSSDAKLAFQVDLPIPIVGHDRIGELKFCDIPKGLAIVGFDRHWWLGSRFVMLESGYIPSEFWSRRLRSIKVVRSEDAPMSTQQVNQVINFNRLGIALHPPMNFVVDKSEPVLSSTEELFFCNSSFSYYKLPPGIKLDLFSDYNFRGQSFQLTNETLDSQIPISDPRRESPLVTFKSYRLAGDKSNKNFTKFAGFFPIPTPLNIFPIFMQAGDRISQLIYPWDNAIHNITVPEGLVAIIYSEQGFKGLCQTLLVDTVLNGKWKNNIRSMEVDLNTQWKGCPIETNTPTIAIKTTTKAPSKFPTEFSEDLAIENTSAIILLSEPLPSKPKTTTRLVPTTSFISIENSSQLRPSITMPTTPKPTNHIKSSESTSVPDDQPAPATTLSSTTIPISSPNHSLVTALAVGGIVVLLAILILGARKKSRSSNELPSNIESFSSLVWHDLGRQRMRINPFPLTHEIASGSTGRLYLGSLHGLQVAVKTLSPNPTCQAVQSFIDEIQLLGSLNNPHIVTLVGVVWTHPSDIQAVIEYMNLGDLRVYLTKTNTHSFAWPDKLQCALHVARGLFYLHSQKMIHRDLKSRNILLDTNKGSKLADFGSAKEQMTENSTMTAMIGTFRWMAPEMLLFKGYTSAVDIYSFGVVLTELSSHALPFAEFEGQSDESIIRRVLHKNMRPSFGVGCPKWLEILSTRCMSGNPDERPSASELIQILESKIEKTTKEQMAC